MSGAIVGNGSVSCFAALLSVAIVRSVRCRCVPSTSISSCGVIGSVCLVVGCGSIGGTSIVGALFVVSISNCGVPCLCVAISLTIITLGGRFGVGSGVVG